MSIYIVKNDRDEEISSYTDEQRARFFADQLQALFGRLYRVEILTSRSAI